ncbi:hypothetical protein FLL45_12375 [Aliikangiella marina]|uniref:DNA alkylation repair protein n=1 Tax=Aliikangiella marina TaxID=1712262 RepID=A0A545T8W7_9GAMM|nr:DNA alkylation repair protein [Aliikangiella marina]TQV73662.1 hypothetical protein FLL45_12375 [Aliikangiella marina]
MNKIEVMALLQANQNERGLKRWQSMGSSNGGLLSYGIGLTQLRKIAKQIGRDHALAKSLWQSNYYDAKVISLLIDEPKSLTREQIEDQVENLNAGMLCHVFSSCDATLAKSPMVKEVAEDWLKSNDETRRRCGYGLLYELSKNKKNKSLNDDFFLKWLSHINKTIDNEENWVRLSQGGALIGIGKRSKVLNKEAIEISRRVGPIKYSDGERKCEPLDVLKHLTSEQLKKKFS